MQRFKLFAGSTAVFMLPVAFASAQLGDTGGASGGAFGDLLGYILQFSNDTLIPFIIGIGFLVFVWGMFQFFIVGGANDDAKEKGKSLMIWAIVGFLLMFILWGIVNLLATSTGLDDKTLKSNPAANNVQM
jgi:hypothetical protein